MSDHARIGISPVPSSSETLRTLVEKWQKAAERLDRRADVRDDAYDDRAMDMKSKAKQLRECVSDLLAAIAVPQQEESGTLKLRTASESVGWLNSVGPLNVSPQVSTALPQQEDTTTKNEQTHARVVEGQPRRIAPAGSTAVGNELRDSDSQESNDGV